MGEKKPRVNMTMRLRVLTALFLVIITDQWHSAQAHHLPAIIGIAASVLCLVIFGPDSFIIPAMLVITILLTLLRKHLDPEEAEVDANV